MNFLSPEIEAWYKDWEQKSLVRPTISCGIFQDCDYTEEKPISLPEQKIEDQHNR